MSDIPETLKQSLVEILAGSGLILAMVLRRWLLSILGSAARFVAPQSEESKEREAAKRGLDIDDGLKMYEALIELRMKVEADRVHIIQFHNGDKFIAGNPIWKMTCTHETCREGVSFEAKNIHAMPVSQLTCELSWLWDRVWNNAGPMTPAGIVRVKCAANCKPCPQELKVILINTESLPPSFFRTTLEARGTRFGMSSPVVVGDMIVGYIAVDYTSGALDMDRVKAKAHEVCETAKRVAYYLRPGGA
jgi:hypothetical protein